ncbi:MAG: DNA polymerase III subunit gamma/tau [Clostridia bacterium]
MSYKALYREWRPATFDEVIEQEHITRTLRNAVKTGRIAHAYLFCGTRGTGKTSMAYILSRAVNCLDPRDGNPCNKCSICTGILKGNIMDVIEMDAASNNSVDNIRTIRDEVAYTPAMASYKVYIIDEVHMLSTGAFNALLKTLEEPPDHVIFILATTEPHRLPATVLSRCQRYDFHRISMEGIQQRLLEIIKDSDVEITERAIRIIARVANGALRDAISLLDQCISSGNKRIDADEVLESAGILQDEAAADLADALFDKDISRVMEITDSVLMHGKSTSQFLSSLIYYYRNLLVCSGMENPEMFIEGGEDIIGRMKQQAGKMGKDLIIYTIRELSAAESIVKKASQPRTYLEVVLINISSMNISFPEQASMLERIAALENKVNRLKKAGADSVPVKVKEAPVRKNLEKPAPEETHAEPAAVETERKSIPRNIIRNWNEVMDYLKNRGMVDVFPYLSGTEASMEGNVINITFNNNLFKNLISKNREGVAAIKKAADTIYKGDFEINIYGNGKTPVADDYEKNARKAAEALGIDLEVE